MQNSLGGALPHREVVVALCGVSVSHERLETSMHTRSARQNTPALSKPAIEADESMRIRLEGVPHRYHEDRISAKGINLLSRYNLVHKFIPMPQASKKPDAKAAVEKEWEKLKKRYRHGS